MNYSPHTASLSLQHGGRTGENQLSRWTRRWSCQQAWKPAFSSAHRLGVHAAQGKAPWCGGEHATHPSLLFHLGPSGFPGGNCHSSSPLLTLPSSLPRAQSQQLGCMLNEVPGLRGGCRVYRAPACTISHCSMQ